MKKLIFSLIICGVFFASHSASAQTINCDVKPFVPPSCFIVEHQKGGMLEFNPQNFSLYLSEKQKGGSITDSDLQKELSGKKLLNGNVLDYLLAHPDQIPEEWKKNCVLFMGTIYKDSGGHLGVRFLAGRTWGYVWLEGLFYKDFPVAIANGE
ncbi:hypothetical protein KKG19_04495 [Patescibacteria group bacterium]|nr:hypothetical protein [Patescibacteria group bacterium]